MTKHLALPTLIALDSCALNKPTLSSLAVRGEISISGTIIKVEEWASVLQVCLVAGAKKILIPITSAADHSFNSEGALVAAAAICKTKITVLRFMKLRDSR